MKKSTYLLLSVLALIACNQDQAGHDRSNGDVKFQKLADDYLTGYLAWRPGYGVWLGYHEYDGKAPDLTKASIDNELARLKDFDQRISQTDTTSLSPKIFYDYRILRSAIKLELFSFEDMDVYHKNPMIYAEALNVGIYVKRNFGPIEDRVKSIITTENTAPQLVAAAMENLKDSLARPYIDLSIQIARGTVQFLNGDLKLALKEVNNDTLMKSFELANKTAVDAMNNFATWLEKKKLPGATDKYAIGETRYKKMLLYNEGITLSPEKVLEIGLRQLKLEQQTFNHAAKIINPQKKPVDVYHDLQKEHPTAENLIPEVNRHLEAIRKFLVDKDIVTMPAKLNLVVKETPDYLKATNTASNDDPGPFETKATEAYYYITPVDPKWTAQQKEDWLRQFDYYTTDNVSIHETYPGHYTQFLHLKASSATRIEKIFPSFAFVEGWAHYCEQMMADEGYGHNGDSVLAAKYRLAQSGDALARLCRLCVSVKIHCQGMSIDEATKFFMDNWYQGEQPSRREALRGAYNPEYLFYTLGKLELFKLREDYQKQEGTKFSLKKFHDEVLNHGMPQIRLLREVMLKDKKTWGENL
jgi:uncharacterized protein (DUF885 family)